MKILIISTPEELGGGETYVRNLIKGLPRHKFSVVTSLSEFHNQLNSDGIKSYLIMSIKFLTKIHIILFLILIPFNIILYLFYLIKLNPDIIHIQSKEEQILVTPLGRLLGKRVIWTVHGPVEKGNRVVDFMFLKSSFMANKIIAVSKFVKESIYNFEIRGKVVVVYHGIDLKRFKPSQINNTEKIIGMVGRLVKIKRPEIFMEVVSKILPKLNNTKAWIVGDGYLKYKLQESIAVFPFKDRIKFLGFRQDIESIIKQFTILLITSQTEGLDISAIEAIASGIPVVSVNVGALSEVISKETGLLVNSDDPKIIASCVLSIIQNNNLLAKLKKSCRKVAEKNFSLDRMITETDLVYTT